MFQVCALVGFDVNELYTLHKCEKHSNLIMGEGEGEGDGDGDGGGREREREKVKVKCIKQTWAIGDGVCER